MKAEGGGFSIECPSRLFFSSQALNAKMAAQAIAKNENLNI
ncbi:hypothetical protein [Nitrosomonas eutropha]|nr:hypothetical protein [Nitrosomonas eutropha]